MELYTGEFGLQDFTQGAAIWKFTNSRLKSFGLWLCVIGLVVLDVLKVCGASEMSWGTHTRTQYHVAEDLNLQHHYCETFISHVETNFQSLVLDFGDTIKKTGVYAEQRLCEKETGPF